MWITWKVNVRETCFCKKSLTDFTVSWVLQKYFNFVPMLESRNVDHVKSNCSWDIFCEKILADITVSWVLQKYFHFVPMLESRNIDQMKSNCPWDMFLWKNSGGLHSFMSSSEIFQFCTCARITKCRSHEKLLFGHHSFISFSELFQLCTHARITEYGSIKK